MHFEGTIELAAPKERVFSVILDPLQMSKCLPDVQKIQVNSPEDFRAVVRVGVSFIRGDFTVNFKVVERSATHARLLAHGSGIGSTIDLDILLDLSDSEKGSSMVWSTDARVGGRIASVGQRMIDVQAEKMVKSLFDCMQREFEVKRAQT